MNPPRFGVLTKLVSVIFRASLFDRNCTCSLSMRYTWNTGELVAESFVPPPLASRNGMNPVVQIDPPGTYVLPEVDADNAFAAVKDVLLILGVSRATGSIPTS